MRTNNVNALDRGDMGAVPDPDWTSRISRLSLDQVDEHIAQYASFGPLSRDTVLAIIQHQPPAPPGWDRFPSVLDEHVATVARWKVDVQRGAIPENPTPNELASWCDSVGVLLPPSFVERLGTVTHEPQLPRQATETIPYPPWLGAPQQTSTAQSRKRPRGRPKSPQSKNADVIAAGKTVLLDAARKGNVVTIPQIAKKLRQMPEFAGMDTSTICRRLNGKLPLDKAKDMRGLANTGAQRHRWKN